MFVAFVIKCVAQRSRARPCWAGAWWRLQEWHPCPGPLLWTLSLLHTQTPRGRLTLGQPNAQGSALKEEQTEGWGWEGSPSLPQRVKGNSSFLVQRSRLYKGPLGRNVEAGTAASHLQMDNQGPRTHLTTVFRVVL